MLKVTSKEYFQIGTITFLGVVALAGFVFWLKGYKIQQFNKFQFYFRNVNGLEEGAALRWNGMKIGVVENIEAVKISFNQPAFPTNILLRQGRRHLDSARESLNSTELSELVFAREKVNQAQLEIALAKESINQKEIIAGEFVQVDVVVTKPSVPIGPMNQITIVPSGLIGEQYVEITTIDLDEDLRSTLEFSNRYFVVLEPVRLDSLIRANLESAEAITNLTNRFNAIITEEDAENIKSIIEAASDLANDVEFRENIKEASKNISEITEDFKLWKLIF